MIAPASLVARCRSTTIAAEIPEVLLFGCWTPAQVAFEPAQRKFTESLSRRHGIAVFGWTLRLGTSLDARAIKSGECNGKEVLGLLDEGQWLIASVIVSRRTGRLGA